VPHPLEHSYNWRTATVFASLAALICVGVLARNSVPGRLWALVMVVVLWALIVGVIYLRTRAYLLVDGSRLTVRRFRRFHTIEGSGRARGRGVPHAERTVVPADRTGLEWAEFARGRTGCAAPRRPFSPLHVDTGPSTAGAA
jgi:hypothetical protein